MSTNVERFKMLESYKLLLDLKKSVSETPPTSASPSVTRRKAEIISLINSITERMGSNVENTLEDLMTAPMDYNGGKGGGKSYKKRMNKNKRTKRNRK